MAARPYAEKLAQPQKRIVIVDADTLFVCRFEALLQERGIYAIEVLDHGRGAASYILADLPVIITLDPKLPDVDGLDVLRELREDLRTGTLPVFVFSRGLTDARIAQTYAAGADMVLDKQDELDSIADLIGGMFRQ